ncbi:hypothetical protein [Microbacterium ureisolvens]|uniref:Nuclear transport factor 2 family protein n=1 Tax=Microbacterium ureisolvens TaxID=2781186 RepID=A0ABS7HX21_9MICO|nr:hypothetical protein [Microbacterium ureisolvens]MBW9108808.1 hypothetical protein [Microbacterium ureisolvens]
MRTRVTAAALSGLLALALAGCTTPEPEPTPTSAFSSEDEAFAAAEETYRAYVDALNQVDLSDPETFEAVYSWTTADASAGERRSLSTMHADGWTVTGQTVVQSVELESIETEPGAVRIAVCSDVSAVDVIDESGSSVVAADRPPIQSSSVTLTSATHSPTGLLISAIEGGGHECGQ